MLQPLSSLPATLAEALAFETPSFDRPFGFSLWDLTAYLTSAATGGYDINAFQFVAGETPLSSLTPVAGLIALYYVVIFGGQAIMTGLDAAPRKFNGLFQLHNFTLTALSLLLLSLLVEQLVPILYHHGLFYAICDEGAWTQPIVFVYYLNYLNKFLEFIDTVFLFLRRKPLTLLHTYHHGATALLCYLQLIGHTSVSWVAISLNLFVHVIMYWYYFQSSRGVRVWWKQWVTRTQIIQFVIDLVFIYFASYTYYVTKYMPGVLPAMGSCAGEEFAAVSGCLILTSYLFLFIGFYIRVYTKGISKKRAAARAAKAKSEEVSAASASGSAASATVSKSRKA